MPTILQLCRNLESSSPIPATPGIELRHYEGESDIAPWLELRHRAFARQRLGVRQWSQDDFLREFVQHWWWRPQWMWIAEAPPHEPAGSPQRHWIGSITLAMRGEPNNARPVVHWLMVHPAWRRRGIGRLLIAHLESAVYTTGYRQIWLETHAAWDAAARFYESLGFRAAD